MQAEASQPRVIDTNPVSVELTNTPTAQQRNPTIPKSNESKNLPQKMFKTQISPLAVTNLLKKITFSGSLCAFEA